jgi:hypothetical protein
MTGRHIPVVENRDTVISTICIYTNAFEIVSVYIKKFKHENIKIRRKKMPMNYL